MLAATRARAVDLLLLARPVRPATATVIVGVDERSAAAAPAALRAGGGVATIALRARARGASGRLAPAGRPCRALRRSARRRRRAGGGAPARRQRDHAGGRTGGAGLRSHAPASRRSSSGSSGPPAPSGTLASTRASSTSRRPGTAWCAVSRWCSASARSRSRASPWRPWLATLGESASSTRRGRADRSTPRGAPSPSPSGTPCSSTSSGCPSEPGGGGPFRIIPMIDVLDGAFDPQEVRDKIVLVGFSDGGRRPAPHADAG